MCEHYNKEYYSVQRICAEENVFLRTFATFQKHGLTKHVLHIHACINYNSDSDVHDSRTIHRLELKTPFVYIYICLAAINFWEKSRNLIKPHLHEWGHGALNIQLNY